MERGFTEAFREWLSQLPESGIPSVFYTESVILAFPNVNRSTIDTTLHRLLKENVITRITRGIFCKGEAPPAEETLYQKYVTYNLVDGKWKRQKAERWICKRNPELKYNDE